MREDDGAYLLPSSRLVESACSLVGALGILLPVVGGGVGWAMTLATGDEGWAEAVGAGLPRCYGHRLTLSPPRSAAP